MTSDERTTTTEQPPQPPPAPPEAPPDDRRGKGKQPKRSGLQGRIFLVLGLLLLVALGGLFAVIIAPAEAPRDCEPGDTETAVGESGLGQGEIRNYSVCKTGTSETAWVHYVPAEGIAEQPMEDLDRCTQGLSDLHDTVNCYAYATDEAFEASDVTEDGELGRECWSAHFRQTQEEGGRGLLSNPDYESEGCPSV